MLNSLLKINKNLEEPSIERQKFERNEEEKIESKSGILIFSDHGYTINHNFKKQDKYEEPRYLHGGKSFHEIIVPWAFLYKP